MSFSNWITFVFAACLIAVSPGAGAVLSMTHGMAYGVKQASATIVGLQAGLLLLLGVAGAGVGSLLLASAPAFIVVKTVGAAYLMYLGWRQWRAPVGNGTGPAPDGDGPAAAPVRDTAPALHRRLTAGFVTNATNPKGVVFMVAVLPQFIEPSRPLAPQLAILAGTMCTIDLAVMHGYAFAAASMRRFFSDARALKKQNRVFGGLLMAVGAALLFVKRTPAA